MKALKRPATFACCAAPFLNGIGTNVKGNVRNVRNWLLPGPDVVDQVAH